MNDKCSGGSRYSVARPRPTRRAVGRIEGHGTNRVRAGPGGLAPADVLSIVQRGMDDFTKIEAGTEERAERLFLDTIRAALDDGPQYVVVGTGSSPDFVARIEELCAVVRDERVVLGAAIVSGRVSEWPRVADQVVEEFGKVTSR